MFTIQLSTRFLKSQENKVREGHFFTHPKRNERVENSTPTPIPKNHPEILLREVFSGILRYNEVFWLEDLRFWKE